MLLVSTYVVTCHASFLNVGWGTRPIGMGGVFTALSDDANAPVWNPAGIAQVEGREGTFMYAMPYSSLGIDLQSYNYFGYVQKMQKIGSVAFGWTNLSHQIYKEDQYIFSYARYLGGVERKMAFGANIKWMQVTYDNSVLVQTDDPVFSGGNTKSSISIDVGFLMKLKKLALGLVIKDVNGPDMGLSISEPIPMEIRAGAVVEGIKTTGGITIIPGVEFSSRGKDQTFHIGGEIWLANKNIALRGGGNNQEIALGASYFWPLNDRFKLGIDYSYVSPFNLQNTGGTHRVSTTAKF